MIACLRLYTVPAAGRFLLAQKATQKGAGTGVVPDLLLFIPVLECRRHPWQTDWQPGLGFRWRPLFYILIE